MNDLDHLSLLDPADGPMPQDAKTGMLVALTTGHASQRRGRKRLIASLAGAFVVTASGGGIAYAVLSGQPEQSALGIKCGVLTTQSDWNRDHEVRTSMPNISGDPVADCAAEYTRLTGTTPSLIGYTSGESSLLVIPSMWTPPTGWPPLPASFRVDDKRLELAQRLQDVIAGPTATCLSQGATEAKIQSDENDLGLIGWITTNRTTADANGSTTCALASVDDNGTNTVRVGAELVAERAGVTVTTAGYPNISRLAGALKHQISDRCLTLTQAQQTVTRLLDDAGIDTKDAKVPATIDASAACTRVVMVPAGLTVIVLRGPQIIAP